MTKTLPPSPYPFLNSTPGCAGRLQLLGAPLDRTASFRAGSAGGPAAIRWASENLESYSPYLDRDLEDITFGDLGDLDFTDLSQQQAIELIRDYTGVLLDKGYQPLLFGGEHTIALGIARAVFQRFPDALLLHFDAHADLRESYLGEALSHAAWAYHVGTEFGFEKIVQLGIRSGLREEFQLGRSRCAYFRSDLSLTPAIRRQLLSRPIYLSLDIDVLDASVAPGTGTPEAGGESFLQLIACLQELAAMQVVAMDINEVAPNLDPSGITSAVAAKLAREMILLYATK